MTVLMTADAVGGVWNFSLSLCAALPETRFVLAVMGPAPSDAQRRAAAVLRNVALETGDFRLEWMEGATADLAASRHWLGDLARRYDPDLLHINGYAHAVNDTGRPVVVVAHSDVCSWWRAVHGEAAPPAWDGYRRVVMAGLRAADRITAPTASVVADLTREYAFAAGHAGVILNGIDLAAFRPTDKRPLVMATGRVWDEAKNLRLLDDIAAELAWPVEIAGPATHPQTGFVHLRAARQLGVVDPGDLAYRLAGAAVFAAPARYEPFGLGILEAAASGCALVLGDIPSLRETWDGAALFVPADDRAGWQRVLAELIADPPHRQALAAAARQRALGFSRERMAAGYAALYRELAGLPGRREVA